MNQAGDAAEQIARVSIQGVELALRITGTAAKEIALLLIAMLKSPEKEIGKLKLKGKARLSNMLKSGKALEIFSLKDTDLKTFSEVAKKYGIVYSVLRNTKNNPDGLCDVLVKADDAPKISRIIERYGFAKVDRANVAHENEADQSKEAHGNEGADAPTETQDINNVSDLLNDLLGNEDINSGIESPESEAADAVNKNSSDKEDKDNSPLEHGETGQPPPQIEQAPDNLKQTAPQTEKPTPVTEQNPHQSAHTSGRNKSFARDTSDKPSVMGEVREIKAARKAQASEVAKRDDQTKKAKQKVNQVTTHSQPQNKKKLKTNKMKGSR